MSALPPGAWRPIIWPDEPRLERGAQAMRRTALQIARYGDIDPMALYRETRGGGTYEGFLRHVWWYVARTGLDVAEADIAACVDRHHSTIQSGCARIEDYRDNPNISAEMKRLCEDASVDWRHGRAFLQKLEEGFAQHTGRPLRRAGEGT